ncbi:hypothetical protein NXC24_PC00512 (plasmid) [Rhizobium sp. NXC24]|nr:hypothetical protein NXC24_PC00512 [Rhizobium sp. NXC24]
MVLALVEVETGVPAGLYKVRASFPVQVQAVGEYQTRTWTAKDAMMATTVVAYLFIRLPVAQSRKRGP